MSKAYPPKIRYLVPSPRGHVPLDEITSNVPLRLTRGGTPSAFGPPVTLGQYFRAIKDVISRDTYGPLVDATARQLGEDISLTDIQQILIYGEKHGSDYHPARIEVAVNDASAAFVMNVAVTARGKDRLCREFDVLQHLNSKYSYRFLPQTYFRGETLYRSGPGENNMLMFLADWFKGYHEFHLSIDQNDHSQKLVVWDTDKGHQHLSPSQAGQAYRLAAKMLTLHYDIKTFEQIFPWHHAAGDFIVRAQEDFLDVKLVTARQYAPMVERSEGVSVQEGLLFFLLNLSIRMRLDRLDGVGAVAWADDECLDATLEGFVEGLRIKEAQGMIEGGFVDGFIQHLRFLSKSDLSARFHALADACDQGAPDMPVIRGHLDGHVSKFRLTLRNLGAS